MNYNITFSGAFGADTGPNFGFYDNADGYTTQRSAATKTALETGITPGSYLITGIDNTATIIRLKSIGTCTNYTDYSIPGTTTTTTTAAGTTTTTTTAIPVQDLWVARTSANYGDPDNTNILCGELITGANVVTGTIHHVYFRSNSTTPAAFQQLYISVNPDVAWTGALEIGPGDAGDERYWAGIIENMSNTYSLHGIYIMSTGMLSAAVPQTCAASTTTTTAAPTTTTTTTIVYNYFKVESCPNPGTYYEYYGPAGELQFGLRYQGSSDWYYLFGSSLTSYGLPTVMLTLPGTSMPCP